MIDFLYQQKMNNEIKWMEDEAEQLQIETDKKNKTDGSRDRMTTDWEGQIFVRDWHSEESELCDNWNE